MCVERGAATTWWMGWDEGLHGLCYGLLNRVAEHDLEVDTCRYMYSSYLTYDCILQVQRQPFLLYIITELSRLKAEDAVPSLKPNVYLPVLWPRHDTESLLRCPVGTLIPPSMSPNEIQHQHHSF